MQNPHSAASTEQTSGFPAPMRTYLALMGLAAVIVALDQALKLLVASGLSGGRIIDLFGGLVRLDYTRNTGAAFGMYQSGGVMFAGVALAVCVGIVLYARRLARSPWVVRAALALILGGALGNLLDRIRLGYVVDFIDLRWWPVFNVADSAIVVGVALLVLHSLLGTGRRSPE